MKQLLKLFGAHMKMTFREKQVWFWSVFYPVMLLVVFLMIFGGSDGKESNFKAKVAAVADRGQPASVQLYETLRSIPALEWKTDETVTRGEAEEWVKLKEIDAAIILTGTEDGKVELLYNKEKQNSGTIQALSGIIGGVLQETNYRLAGVSPKLTLMQQGITSGSEKLKFVDFLMTGLIALSISQAGLFGMMSMVEMRRNGLLKRLMLTPVNMRLYGLGNMMVRFLLSAIQVILLTLIGILFYKAEIDLNLVSFLPMFLVGTVSFASMGYLIAAFSKSMDSYTGTANLASFIMMFLSGIFFDYSMLPEYIKPVSHVLPLTYFANGIRDSMVYGMGLANADFWVNIGALSLWGIAAFLVASRFYRWKA